MSVFHRRASFIVALGLFLHVGTARADFQLESGLELNLGGGAFIASKQHELYDSTIGLQVPLKRFGLNLNLGLAFFPVQYVGVGVEAGFVPIRTTNDHSAFIFNFRAHGILQLPWIVTPYLLLGGGTMGITSGPNAVGSDFDRALHWGAGFKTDIVDRVAFRLEGKHIVSAAEGPGDGNTNHFEVLAGVSIGLWRSEPDVAQPLVIDPPKPVVEAPVQPEPEPVAIAKVMEAPVVVEEIDCTKAANNPDCKPEHVLRAELERVHFEWGLAVVRPSHYSALDNAVQLLTEHPHLRVEIQGHTDSTGPEGHNVRLSYKRAEAVKAYLLSKGVGADRVATVGFGPSSPIESNLTTEGRAMNRRSEIKVINLNEEETPE